MLSKYTVKEHLRNHIDMIKKIEDIDISEMKEEEFRKSVASIIRDYKKECQEDFERVDITLELYKIICDNNQKWGAYQYVMELGLKTCPYCNRQYITPIYNARNGKLRADLDHFYPKSKYPYLSMSIYNLVPCCKFCNSSLKLYEDFTYKTHINPFDDGFGELMKFKYIPELYDMINGQIKIILEESECCITEEIARLDKCKNNANVFKLESLYNYHVEEVKDLIRKKIIYSKAMMDEIKNTLSELIAVDITEQEVIEFIISNYISEEKLHIKPLSKLYKDIIEQLRFRENLDISIEVSNEELNVLRGYIG